MGSTPRSREDRVADRDKQQADLERAEQADASGGVPTAAERERMDARRIPSTDGGPAPAEPTSAEDSAGLMNQ